jgi:hypothetical protein
MVEPDLNMIPDHLLSAWLKYSDLDPGLTRFVGNDYIVTDAFIHRSLGEPSSSWWEMEEWCVGSVLVSVERLNDAQRVLTYHDIKIQPQWIDRHRFDFGVSAEFEGIPAKPWSFMREHRANRW